MYLIITPPSAYNQLQSIVGVICPLITFRNSSSRDHQKHPYINYKQLGSVTGMSKGQAEPVRKSYRKLDIPPVIFHVEWHCDLPKLRWDTALIFGLGSSTATARTSNDCGQQYGSALRPLLPKQTERPQASLGCPLPSSGWPKHASTQNVGAALLQRA